ncbi:MAG: dienelactone hydrolase family protein [Gammaproteobacteria bacterium]|nr:dienelactone hydrolase family protein [Gammaproteobacteria bacterium]
MRKLIALLTFSLFSLSVFADIKTEEIKYTVNGKEFTGYMAYDESKKKRPGVLVIHEWWGHNDYARKRARMLAKLGYTAFALDMYGTGVKAEHPEDAKKFMNATFADFAGLKAKFQAAHSLLKNHKTVDASKTATIGYCMGGGINLAMARTGENLNGFIVVHGSLGTKTPVKQGDIKGKILVLNGAADPFVPAEQVAAFEKEMKTAKVEYKLVNYKDAKHAFSNPGATEKGKKFNIPLAYNKKADKASWKEVKKFLKKIF